MEIPSARASQVSFILHRFPCPMVLLQCIWLCTLQQLYFDWWRTGITMAGLPLASPTSQTDQQSCGMSQKQQIVFQGSWVSWSSWEASKDAGEPADVTARSLSAPRGLGHWKSLFMTGKMQILAGKEGRITPQGIFPFVIWGAKTSKAQHGLSQVLPIFPVKSFQWLTGVNNIPLLMEREGN